MLEKSRGSMWWQAEVRRRRVVASGIGFVFAGLLVVLALTNAFQTTSGVKPASLLDAGCEEQMAAAADALGWSSVSAYEKNLRAEGHPVGCVVPGAQPTMAASSNKLAGSKPHAVGQNKSIMKWMFGDLFDDHPQKSLNPTALHVGGKPAAAPHLDSNTQVTAKKKPVVHRTAAERSFDKKEAREEYELRTVHSERHERRIHRQLPEIRADQQSERGLLAVERKENVLREREAHDARVEERVAVERKALQKLRAEEVQASEQMMRQSRQTDAAKPTRPSAPARRGLANAMADGGNLWGDTRVLQPAAAAASAPLPVAMRRESSTRRPRHDDDERSVEQVQTMADEAKALGYKLVPAGLEAKAQQMGYDLVPRATAPEPTVDAAMRAQEGERSAPANLEVLAERDVVHQMSIMTQTKDAKRLQQQARLEARLKLEFKAQHDVKMAQLREQSRAKRAAEHRNADSAIQRYATMLSFPDESRHAEMKLLEEHLTGEKTQDTQVAMERKNAGKLARTQLSQYNLLTFDEDEVCCSVLQCNTVCCSVLQCAFKAIAVCSTTTCLPSARMWSHLKE